MTPDAARQSICDTFGAAAAEAVGHFLDRVVAENARQNLIAPSTVAAMWSRHALDSSQLLRFDPGGLWLDVGTGGGFPGFIVALLRDDPVVMVEPRKRRAQFLQDCVDQAGLNARVLATGVEKVEVKAHVVSARAVAPAEKLLHMAAHCATVETRWLLPRGQFGDTEMAALAAEWEGMFHVEQSITDPQSAILIINGTRKR